MCSFKVNGEFHIIGGRSDTVSSVEYRHFKMEPNKVGSLIIIDELQSRAILKCIILEKIVRNKMSTTKGSESSVAGLRSDIRQFNWTKCPFLLETESVPISNLERLLLLAQQTQMQKVAGHMMDQTGIWLVRPKMTILLVLSRHLMEVPLLSVVIEIDEVQQNFSTNQERFFSFILKSIFKWNR